MTFGGYGPHEGLDDQVFRHGQRMPRLRRNLELPLLPATQAEPYPKKELTLGDVCAQNMVHKWRRRR